MSNTRRVVVTGTGVVTPVGNNVETFWKNITNGVCGIDYITQFPTDDLPVKIAGEVKDFNRSPICKEAGQIHGLCCSCSIRGYETVRTEFR